MSDGLFGAIRISASGLRGQRTKMDVVARNLANAETTRTAEGTPYGGSGPFSNRYWATSSSGTP